MNIHQLTNFGETTQDPISETNRPRIERTHNLVPASSLNRSDCHERPDQ